jgi:hypothetical protein
MCPTHVYEVAVEPQLAIGTWRVVRVTGQYAGIVGKGGMPMQRLGSP